MTFGARIQLSGISLLGRSSVDQRLWTDSLLYLLASRPEISLRSDPGSARLGSSDRMASLEYRTILTS